MSRHRLFCLCDAPSPMEGLRAALDPPHIVLHGCDFPDALVHPDPPPEARVDLVILDLGLARADGLDLLEKLRSSSLVPLLLLVDAWPTPAQFAGLRAHPDIVLRKPVSPLELRQRVAILCGQPIPTRDVVERLRARLAHTLASPWRVAALARLGGMSPRTLEREFAAQVGTTPTRYLTHLRMREASRRLAVTDESIAQIARAVGYPHPGNFATAFRRHEGMEPRAFRRHARAGTPRTPGTHGNGMAGCPA
jgi:AraC-like DNA-binding protein